MVVCGNEASQNPTGKTEENASESITNLTSITVAIIDFESKAPGNPELGQQLGDILSARMSIYEQFQLVERKKLEELLKEHQLNLTGIVDTNQAMKVGKLLGAKIMVFGRAFPVDKDLFIVAKIIGTETSQVKGVIAKGKMESNLSDIIDQLVDKLTNGLEKWAPQLLPPNEQLRNKIEILNKQLADEELPTVAVIVPETHINRQIADPAAETEIKKVFKEVGFKVIEAKRKNLGRKSKDIDLTGVDMVITGEGLSEFGARIGGLVSCIGRLEIQATDKDKRTVITSERTTRRAVDLSEAIAAKTALQAAGHELAIKTIEKIAEKIDREHGKD
jgi:curli biogenesis system outer membrane secretion channel CsgG